MVFYINKIRIKVEYSLLLIIAFSLFLENKSILYVLLFSSIHECAHLIALLSFKEKPSEINFAFYGIGMKYSCRLTFIKELIVLLAGAAVNILFYLLDIQREINYSLALINLLPVYPLDGGRAAKLIINKLLCFDIADRVFKIISVVFITAFVISSILSKNFSLIFISIYIIIFAINNSFD